MKRIACIASMGFAIATFVVGLYAARLWFRASKIPIRATWEIGENGTEGTEPGEHEASQDGWLWGTIDSIVKSSELNKRAAWWTGVAIILGTVSNLISVSSSCF